MAWNEPADCGAWRPEDGMDFARLQEVPGQD